MPVTSRHQAKKSEEVREKASDRPAASKAKNGSLPEQDWESVADGDLNKCLHRVTFILQSYVGIEF
jgi:translation elongation factor EF-Ts